MADTGYGVHTKNLIRRLKDDHEVAVHSVGGWEGMGIDWEGVHIYPSGAGKHGEQSIPYWFDKTDSDIVFSHHDHWAMADTLSSIQQNGIPMALYTILDHDLPGKRPPEAVVKANEGAVKSIVMSEWAEKRMKNSRVPQNSVSQIPHGVNINKYAPVTEEIPKEELKRDLGIPEDSFLFGMVAANYGPRKNIPVHMQAFKNIRDEYGLDDAYFYIHTHPTMGGGYNLYDVRNALNIDEEHCIFPDPHEMYHGLEDMVVVQLYNTFDVHLNITQSESWGMTVTEAMSSGTPVIAANNSAMTEQFGVPHNTYVSKDDGYRVTSQGILVHRGAEMWTQNATARRYTSYREDIENAMLYYYNNRDKIDEHGKNAREWVVDNYDWDYVYKKHWRPLFNELEEELSGEYGNWYFKRREQETQSQAFKQEAFEVMMEVRGTEVLDIGCGTGTLMEYLKEKGYKTTGIEKHQAGIDIAKEKELDVHEGDIRDINMKDDSFDTVVSQHVLEHIEADAHALSEMCRVATEKVISIVPEGNLVEEQPDDTEVRRYRKNNIERLKDEFEELTDYAMEYKKIQVGNNNENWLITVQLEKEDK